MCPTLQILLVEDSQDDALLLGEYFQEQGLESSLTRVEDLEGLQAALAARPWDVLLSDFNLPTMNGFEVIREARRLRPDLPAIILSGWIDEAAAVEAMRSGAKDFIAKNRLTRLVPAILREVGEARDHARANEVKAELDEAENRLGAIVGNALDGIIMMDDRGRISFWNPAAERIFGYTKAEALGEVLHDLIAPTQFRDRFRKAFAHFMDSGEGDALGKVMELGGLRKDGRQFPLEITVAPLRSGGAWHAVGILRDITERKRLEIEQLESLQFLETLVETIPSPLYYQDPEGHIVGCNQAMKDFFGLAGHEILGKTMADFLPEQVCEMSTALDRFLLEKKGIQEFSARLELKTLGLRSVIFRRASYSHADGRNGGIVGTLLDVTDLKQAAASLRETNAYLENLINCANAPIIVWDSEFKIIRFNRAFESLTGKSESEMLGATLEVLFPADLVGPTMEMIRSTMTGGRLETAEIKILHCDGAQRIVLWNSATLFAPDGRTPLATIAQGQDITERKHAEEALRQTEALFSVIHQYVVDLIAIIDPFGKRLYNSPSYRFVLGYSTEDMDGMGSMDLLHPEDRKRVDEALVGLGLGRPVQGLEYRLRHKDGRWLNFESTAALIPGTKDGATRALIVARNVTERKEEELRRAAMEIQFRQAQKLEAIGQLASGIAHEINTPTQYIGDNATFLRDSFDEAFTLMGRLMAHLKAIERMGGPAGESAAKALAEMAGTDLEYLGEEIPKAVRQTLEGVERISKIVSAMKEFSHPGGESKTLVDLHRAIESTITVCRNEWKYVATVETDFDPGLQRVPCYPGEFNQVVLNLIVNAAHAIEEAKGGRGSGRMGRIVVKSRNLGGEVLISVADDGAGIPKEIQARIFEPYFTTKPVGKGSGQGLAIVHSVVVDKHRGRVEVDSAPGEGTVFRIFLPVEKPGPQ